MKASNKISRRTFLGDSAKGLIALGIGASSIRVQETSPADLILIGAPVLTVDSNNAVKQSLAVKGHQIVAVETDVSSILELAGPGTKILQLPRAQCVTPGMIDVHNHIVAQASNTIGWVDLIRCNSAKQVRETLARWIIDNDWDFPGLTSLK